VADLDEPGARLLAHLACQLRYRRPEVGQEVSLYR
jgi:hypothetical protein